MKHIELNILLHDLYGTTSFRRFESSDHWTRISGASERIDALLDLLNRLEASTNASEKAWPDLWFSLERETLSEMEAAYPDDEGIEELLEEHPHQTNWYRVAFVQHEKILRAFLYPTDTVLAIREDGSFEVPPGVRGRDSQHLLRDYVDWFTELMTSVLRRVVEDVAKYNHSLEETLPRRERFGKILRKDLWRGAASAKQLFRYDLTPEEAAQFEACVGAARDSEAETISDPVTLSDFLRWCEICYEGAGYDIRGLSPREKYMRLADGRDDGLLAIDSDSANALSNWFASRQRGGHPWEIARGGNRTHISLHLSKVAGGYQLHIAGSALTRGAETVRMALALWRENVPFVLVDADLHRRRVQGTDWIGIVPDYYAGADASSLFPASEMIHDLLVYQAVEEHPHLMKYIRWCDLEGVALKPGG